MRRKASSLSVYIRQVLVVPIEVAAAVDPVFGVGESVDVLFEPPNEKKNLYYHCF